MEAKEPDTETKKQNTRHGYEIFKDTKGIPETRKN